MGDERLGGHQGYLYIGTLGTEVEGDGATPLPTEGYYKVTQLADSSSAFEALDSNIKVGDIVYNKPELTPAAGTSQADKCKPVTLEKLAFVVDVPKSANKNKYENSVQTDDVRSYIEGRLSEMTGSVNGMFVLNNTEADMILKRFFRVVTDDGEGTYTYTATTTGVIHFFLSRRETSTVGEKFVMEYMPSIIDSLTVDKPMEGPQTLNFNYTVIGSERPSVYYREITA